MIVVDTQAVLWLNLEPGKLSGKASDALRRGYDHGGMAISDVTLREIAWIVSAGRISIPGGLGAYLKFVESHFAVIPIDGRIAERSTQFTTAYPKDPADRIIGATAVVHGAALVTADRAIRNSGEVECVW